MTTTSNVCAMFVHPLRDTATLAHSTSHLNISEGTRHRSDSHQLAGRKTRTQRIEPIERGRIAFEFEQVCQVAAHFVPVDQGS